MNLISGLISYWKLDGNSIDSFGGHNGIDTNITYVAGKIKDGAELVGASEIAVGNILPSNSGSINFWIYHNDSINQSYAVWDSNGGYFTVIGTIGYYVVAYYSPTSLSFTMPKIDNVWQMITVTWDGSVVNGYVNGTLQNSLGMSGSLVGFGDILLGRTTVTANFKLDEVGFWNRVLTQQEIVALYNNDIGFQYPFGKILAPISNLTSGLTAYYKLDGNSYDSLNLNNGADTSVVYTQAKIGYGGIFNGASSKIDLAADSFNFDDFSVSAWINPSNLSSSSPYVIFSNYSYPPTPNGDGWYFSIWKSGGLSKIYVPICYSNTSSIDIFSNTIISANTWFHVVLTRKKSARTRIYINGELDVFDTNTLNPQYSGAIKYPTIGEIRLNITNTANPFDGIIDELGIWNRELNASEVLKLYNSGKGFSYPFRRVLSQNNTNLANALIGYFNLNGNADDLIGNFSSTDSSPGYAVGKISLGRNFNGIVGDNITTTQTLNNYTKFSMSIWFNADDLSGYKCVIGSSPFEVFLGGTQIQILWNSGGLVNKFWNFSHSVNSWHNLIVVFDGTLANDDRIKVYGDGVLATEASFPTIPSNFDIQTIYLATSIFGYYYDGILDEFAVWGRVLTDEEIAYIYNNGIGKAYPFFTNILKY